MQPQSTHGVEGFVRTRPVPDSVSDTSDKVFNEEFRVEKNTIEGNTISTRNL